ncbi:MAG: hypothetical protein LC802_06585 [Acidobacteria bacterium]|nr:hypothetical protein [Acidobacteriota bacterium]
MPARSVEQVAQKSTGRRSPSGAGPRRARAVAPRMPSTVGYMMAAGGLSFGLFLIIWFLLRADGDEAPWIPAGLAAGFVILIAAAAREIVMRRAWARYTRELEHEMRGGDMQPRPVLKTASSSSSSTSSSAPAGNWSSMQGSVAALRALQQRLAELDAAGATPEAHLEAYRLCEQYVANSEEALRTSSGGNEMRVALRSGQERVRVQQKKHLLGWARGEATRLTQDAQRRVRLSDRIETAQRALEVLGEALKLYPEESELRDSTLAVRNFIASVKVGQWVEMAERSAFRGKYARAVARYRDALFYLSRADMGEDAREEAATRIQREIELLRARISTIESGPDEPPGADFNGDARRRRAPADFNADAPDGGGETVR